MRRIEDVRNVASSSIKSSTASIVRQRRCSPLRSMGWRGPPDGRRAASADLYADQPPDHAAPRLHLRGAEDRHDLTGHAELRTGSLASLGSGGGFIWPEDPVLLLPHGTDNTPEHQQAFRYKAAAGRARARKILRRLVQDQRPRVGRQGPSLRQTATARFGARSDVEIPFLVRAVEMPTRGRSLYRRLRPLEHAGLAGVRRTRKRRPYLGLTAYTRSLRLQFCATAQGGLWLVVPPSLP